MSLINILFVQFCCSDSTANRVCRIQQPPGPLSKGSLKQTVRYWSLSPGEQVFQQGEPSMFHVSYNNNLLNIMLFLAALP